MGLDNPLHIAVLVVILLLLFGAKRLPEIGRSLGTGMREFKSSISGESPPTLTTGAPQQPVPVQAPVAQPAPVQAPAAQQQPQAPVAQPAPVQAPAPTQAPAATPQADATAPVEPQPQHQA
jgi:sec-independent protein translocase protein TatA